MKLRVPLTFREMDVRQAGLSVRATNALLTGGIRTLGGLDGLSFEDVKKLQNIGAKTAREICDAILQLGSGTTADSSHRRLEDVGTSHGGPAVSHVANQQDRHAPAGEVLSVPDPLRELDIRHLGLSVRAVNALLSGGILVLAQLDGYGIIEIRNLKNVGVGSAGEIFEGVRRICRTSGDEVEHEPGVTEATPPLPDTARADVRIPLALRDWPTAVLGVTSRLLAALGRHNIGTLGQLNLLSPADITGLMGVGVTGCKELLEAVGSLLDMPELDRFPSLNAAHSGRAPALPGAMLEAIVRARTVEEEVSALLLGLPPRNAELIRQRWVCVFGRPPQLEHLGAQHGITRERVRQLVNKQEAMLRSAGLLLPQSSRIVRVIEDTGGALPTQQLLSLLREKGLAATSVTLGLVQSLSDLGLTGAAFRYDRGFRLWLSNRGIHEWVDSGRLAAAARDLKRGVAQDIRQIGAIPTHRLEGAWPFGAAHAVSLVLGRRTRMVRLQDYLVPRPSVRSALTRALIKMLVVSPQLRLSDIHAGLSKRAIFASVPLEVLDSLARHDRTFVVEGEQVALRDPARHVTALKATERALVAAFERAGGLLLWVEYMEAMEAAGVSRPMASALLKQPYVIKRATSLYGLRGRPFAPQLIREKKKQWAAARRESIISARWLNSDQFELRYRLSNMSVGGALSLPAALRRLRTTRWTGRLPDGRELQLRARNGFLWSLHDWFTAEDAQAGDIVVATFYLAEGRVEFNDLVQAGGPG